MNNNYFDYEIHTDYNIADKVYIIKVYTNSVDITKYLGRIFQDSFIYDISTHFYIGISKLELASDYDVSKYVEDKIYSLMQDLKLLENCYNMEVYKNG